jgi:hypothetical protein
MQKKMYEKPVLVECGSMIERTQLVEEIQDGSCCWTCTFSCNPKPCSYECKQHTCPE